MAKPASTGGFIIQAKDCPRCRGMLGKDINGVIVHIATRQVKCKSRTKFPGEK